MATIYIPSQNMSNSLWKNGANENSSHCRSRLVVSYSISSGYPSVVTVDYTLQMARDNGDYDTHGTVTPYINDSNRGAVYKEISSGAARRSNANATGVAIPESYFTTIATYNGLTYTCNRAGAVSISYSVQATCRADNMVLAYRSDSYTVNGGTVYSNSPNMEVTEDYEYYNYVYARCKVTGWGGYSTTDFNSDSYNKYAYLYYNGVYTGRSVEFSDNELVSFHVGPSTSFRDYGIKFSIWNSYFTLEKWAGANPRQFVSPSGPDDVKITYTPSNEEPTIVSSYNLSWNEHNWGSVPDGCIRYFRMRIVVVNKDGLTQYIGYRYGNTNTPLLREWSDISDIWYDFYDLRTGITICKDTYSGELAKLEVGDTISICVHSINYFDGGYFVSGSTWSNPIGPIQDDQAKVKLLDYNSQIVTGKVWVKDETGTWRKAKKIYVDTGTTSKNWEKSTNPTS